MNFRELWLSPSLTDTVVMRNHPPCPHKFPICVFLVSFLLAAGLTSAQAQSAKPPFLRFGEVNEGQTSTMSATLTNHGSSTFQINSVSSTNALFTVGAISLPYTLPAGQSVSLNITFSPLIPQHINADVLVTYTASTTPIDIPVHGTGIVHPWLVVTPASLTFGSVKVGSSASQLVTVTNNGSNSVTISQDFITGPGFSVSGLTLPTTLASHSSITFTVIFAPATSGTVTGNTSLNYGRLTSSIPLSGSTYLAGMLSASPSALAFGTVLVGQSKTSSGTLSASGSAVTINAANVNSTEFSMSGVTFPLTLTPGQTKTYSVTFAPQTSGGASANLSFASNASNSASESLAGSGSPPPSHSVSLAWSDNGGSINGYNVYRSLPGGQYARINTALDSKTDYTDGSVQSGQTYYYAATSVGSDGVESSFSPAVKAVVPNP